MGTRAICDVENAMTIAVFWLCECGRNAFFYADRGYIVCDQFLVEDIQIDGFRLREIEGLLDTRVNEDTIQVGVLEDDI